MVLYRQTELVESNFVFAEGVGKQASNQAANVILSLPCNIGGREAGSARDTCSANVMRKVPGRALQLGFTDHGCESQVQECIITTFPLNAMAIQSHPLQTSKVRGNSFLLQQVLFTIMAAENFLSKLFQRIPQFH